MKRQKISDAIDYYGIPCSDACRAALQTFDQQFDRLDPQDQLTFAAVLAAGISGSAVSGTEKVYGGPSVECSLHDCGKLFADQLRDLPPLHQVLIAGMLLNYVNNHEPIAEAPPFALS